ncbi:MAG: TIM barrel protein [Liquorilactobacillus hordei]|uniref:TIM barrel protein n=2 Tax=Liquorilactobacillus hordei TaxID=468911 RepID=UPI0039EAF626
MKKIDLGLKASSQREQFENRLSYQPNVFEFFTDENDFTTEGMKRLTDAILQVKNQGVAHIILHHPMRYKGEFTELVAPKSHFKELNYFIEFSTSQLLQLSFDYDLQTLLHGSYSRHTEQMISLYPSFLEARNIVYQKLDKFSKLGQAHIMFENSISRLFYYGFEDEDQFILDRNYRLAFDISHCFIKVKANNNELCASLKRLKHNVVHYHLVDSMGVTHDSLQLGKGKIDWKTVVPLLNEKASNIFEIKLSDENDAKEQIESYRYLVDIYNELNKRA